MEENLIEKKGYSLAKNSAIERYLIYIEDFPFEDQLHSPNPTIIKTNGKVLVVFTVYEDYKSKSGRDRNTMRTTASKFSKSIYMSTRNES